MNRCVSAALAMLLMSTSVSAQTVIADRYVLVLGPRWTAGSGSPEGVVTASPGSTYSRTDTGTVYRKATGTGNTGWVLDTGLVPAAGAAGTFLRSNGTSWLVSTMTIPDTLPAGYTLITNAANTISAVAPVALGRVFMAQGVSPTLPDWSNAAYLKDTVANQLLYSSATNVVAGLATAVGGVLVTSATSVPSILAGGATAGRMLRSGASAIPTFSTATWPNTVPVNQILRGTSADVVGSDALLSYNGSTLTIDGGAIGTGAGQNLTLGPAGNLLLNPVGGATTTTGSIGAAGYVSQTTGWLIGNSGSADFRYLYADELRIKLFSVEEQAVYRASLMVTPSHSETSQAFSCPAYSATATLWVRDAATLADARVFASGHSVVIRNFTRTDSDADGNQELIVGDCVGVVTVYADGSGANAGQQSWTFTRGNASNGGTLAGATAISVGSAVLDFGVTGNGAIELNAYDGAEGINAPWIQTKRWTTSPVAANFTVTARLGKLTGITGTADEFGLIAGTYAATNGQYFRASNSAFELHGIDLLLWDGSTNTVKIDHAIPSIALGTPVPTAYGTGTGIWMGKDTDYKFRAGTVAGNRVAWDGTNLTIVSANLTVNSTGVLITPTASAAYAVANAYGFTAATGTLGLSGYDVAGGRELYLQSTWTGAGTKATGITLRANGSSGGFSSLINMTSNGTITQTSIQSETFNFSAPSSANAGLIILGGAGGGSGITQGLELANIAPTMSFTDTSVSAKSMRIILDANVVNFYDPAAGSGSLLALDLTNNRMGLGTATPYDTAEFHANASTVIGSRLLLSNYATHALGNAVSFAAKVNQDFNAATYYSGQFVNQGVGANTDSWWIWYLYDGGANGGTQKMFLTTPGVLKVGGAGAVRGTTEGSSHIDIFDGTAPAGTLTNGVSLYSASGELRSMDAAGNSTLLSPHDKATNEWVFDSTLTTTGKHLRIDVERIMRFINDTYGLDAVHEEGGQ